MNFFSSTKKNRNAQRVNVASQLANGILSAASPIAAIPAKVTQSLVAAFSLFDNLKPQEKILNALQGVLAASEAALAIALFASDSECEKEKSDLCRAITVVGLVYQGILMTHLTIAELKKEHGEIESPSSSPKN